MIKQEIVKRMNANSSCLKEVYKVLKNAGIEEFAEELAWGKIRKQMLASVRSLKELKVAAIMDRFTLDSYAPECQLMEVTPDNWKSEMVKFEPHMLFVESAWEGKDKLWYRKVSKVSKEYCDLVEFCREEGIPVVFWNKEDPVWTDTFMEAASYADYIFTTDIDCIKRYKTELGNDNVFLLHFAAQPQIHNPIEKYERKDKFCFAGAYYHRYPERTRVFDEFAKVFVEGKGFDIYDRNYGNSRPEHAFPEMYNDIILGKLDPSEIDIAYKGYNYGINMNSVNQSQTMFARRVFEMMASNTVTVGNYAKGLRTLFGDLTICTNSAKTLSTYLQKYCADIETYRKYCLLGLRTALMYHLYEDRLNYIVEKVYGVKLKRELPLIKVYTVTDSEQELQYVRNMVIQQTYKNVEFIPLNNTDKENLVIEADENVYITYFNPKDYYGENYLLDMVLTLRYIDVDVIGKKAYYEKKEENVYLNENIRYCACEELSIERAICKATVLVSKSIQAVLENCIIHEGAQFAIDEFNYCKNSVFEKVAEVDDLCVVNQGIPYHEIEAFGEQIQAEELSINNIKPSKLLCGRPIRTSTMIQTELGQEIIRLNSEMPDDKHEYIYFPYIFGIPEIYYGENVGFKIQSEGDLDITAVCVYLNAKQEKIGAVTGGSNKVIELQLSDEVKYVRFGIRPRGSGKGAIKRVFIGERESFAVSKDILCCNDVAVLTNHYPEDSNLYRNMFVHKRVASYKDEAALMDVLCINKYAKEQYREFAGIDVIEGNRDTLNLVLKEKKVKTLCIHFLEQEMWDVLKENLDGMKLVIWSHGSDIQPWWRRSFLYETEEVLEKAKNQSEVKMNMWKEVFAASEKHDIHFVFVSKWLAESVMKDYEYEFKEGSYSVIHNYIDGNMFTYAEKEPNQRTKIISVRPYASKIYANDVTVKTIVELSGRECFNELEFLIIGDGDLFEEITAPLRDFKNVELRKTFLRQDEIATLYKTYGVVLIPSRGDTQGVSRDEAMIAGLVPVTSNVMAIPEFVNEECGYLLDADDYVGMANAIEELYNNPEKFMTMSNNAHSHVIEKCPYVATIGREMEQLLH